MNTHSTDQAPDDGGPAFPVEYDGAQPGGMQTGTTRWQVYGISVRDYFAGRALQGLMGRVWTDPETGKVPDNVHELWTTGAYQVADAMLKARTK